MTAADVVVLRFRRPARAAALAGLPVHDVATPDRRRPASSARRLIVLGTHADLGTVLTRLLRTDRLDVEVGFAARPWTARRARTGTARRVPLIRDETGTVVTEAAFWLPPDETRSTIAGEAVVDDTVLFDGEVTGVRIEPIAELPGLRASVLTGRMRPRRWVTGRAAQLGTTGALVVRDGVRRRGRSGARRSTATRRAGWPSGDRRAGSFVR